MILIDTFKDKRVAVLGFGKTGKSVARALISGAVDVVVHDDSAMIDDNSYSYANLADELVFAKNVSDGMCAIAVSPGVPTLWPFPHPVLRLAKKYNIPLINDMDLFIQNIKSNAAFICITGTNGKSTTSALIHHVFEICGKNSAIGGNFGRPVLDLNADHDFYVLELSSYQLESCDILGFDTSILLNISQDHLQRHGGMSGYIAAKQKIFGNFHTSSKAIIGADDEYCIEIFDFLKSINHPKIIQISGRYVPDRGVGWCGDNLIDNTENKNVVVCSEHNSLNGIHNRQNIAAAYAACFSNGIAAAEFHLSIPSFAGLAHRQELIAKINGVCYINDSKATNMQSSEQALTRYRDIIWILGGRPKGENLLSLSEYFSRIKIAFLIGEIADEWYDILKKHNVDTEIAEALDVAISSANKIAKHGDIVLLSPACASFDQFSNFEERGNVFRKIVKAIEDKDKNEK